MSDVSGLWLVVAQTKNPYSVTKDFFHMKQLFSNQHDNTIDVVDRVFVEVVVERVRTGWTVKLRAKTSFFKKARETNTLCYFKSLKHLSKLK